MSQTIVEPHLGYQDDANYLREKFKRPNSKFEKEQKFLIDPRTTKK